MIIQYKCQTRTSSKYMWNFFVYINRRESLLFFQRWATHRLKPNSEIVFRDLNERNRLLDRLMSIVFVIYRLAILSHWNSEREKRPYLQKQKFKRRASLPVIQATRNGYNLENLKIWSAFSVAIQNICDQKNAWLCSHKKRNEWTWNIKQCY